MLIRVVCVMVGEAVGIREADQDADVLACLIREAFHDVARRFSLTQDNCPKHPSNCTADWIRADRARGARYFVFLQNGVPAGCVGLEAAGASLCYLERLAVLPAHRGQGFGRALVGHALLQAEALGACRVSVGIIAAHTELKHWYLKLGFVETETRDFIHLPFQVTFLEHVAAGRRSHR